MKTEIKYSFDIFDTLITRTTATPEGIFLLMVKEMRRTETFSSYFVDSFYENRIEAEAIARLAPKIEEITISNIYAVLKNKFSLSSENVNFLINLEIEVEINNVLPITKNISKLEKLEKGSVFLVSDMYLPKSVIMELLIKVGIIIDQSRVYLSSDIGKTKNNGTLFLSLINDFNLEPSNLLHFGDNLISDVKRPLELGVRSIHFSESSLNDFESKLLNDKKNLTNQLVVGSLKYLRLKSEQEIYKAGLELGALPFYFYTYWTLDFSLNNNINNIHYISRDGQVLYKLAKIIKAGSTEKFPEINYLYSSRYASYFSNLSFPISVKDLSFFFPLSDKETIETIVAKLKIELFRAEVLLMVKSDDLMKALPVDIKNKLLEKIFQHKEINKYIQRTFQLQSELSVRYYNQVKLNKSRNAIVDIGWMGTTFKSISQSLKQPSELYGLYFGFCSKSFSLNTGKVFSFFSSVSKLRSINANLLELLLYADHGTVIGYKTVDNEVKPQFKDLSSQDANNVQKLQKLQKSYYDFAEIMTSYVDKGLIESQATESLLLKYAAYVKLPNKKIAQQLLDVKFSTNLNDNNKEIFLEKISYKDVLNEFFNGITITRLWLEGARVITPLPIIYIWHILTRFKKNVAKFKRKLMEVSIK